MTDLLSRVALPWAIVALVVVRGEPKTTTNPGWLDWLLLALIAVCSFVYGRYIKSLLKGRGHDRRRVP